MPQLNPSPWLILFVLFWTLTLMLTPTKMNYLFNNPKPLPLKTTKFWIWPW